MKIATIIGARPQFVKTAVVSRALRATPGLQELLIHTGQHYDALLSDIFFSEMDIPAPDYRLQGGSGPQGAQTARLLEAIEAVLLRERPDWVLVFGDTNTTLAGALAAVKLHIPVAHVEAGVRSGNRQMPEEINRIITDQIATLLFAPTPGAVELLRREGIPAAQIHYSGDVMYDAICRYAPRAAAQSTILERLQLAERAYVLATIHRAENADDPARLRLICDELVGIAAEMPVVIPLHPRTRGRLEQYHLLARMAKSLRIIDPVGYLDMLTLERHARAVATDSGGVSKEAFFFQRPCIILREETEYPELLATGSHRLLVPRQPGALPAALRELLAWRPAATAPALFGDGQASQVIARVLRTAGDVC